MNSHRWIQVTLEEDKTLREKKHIPENVVGTKILCEGKEMIEYHVDDCKYLFEIANKTLKFGGNLSKRRDKSKPPYLVFGQDECIFSQYSFKPMTWVSPDGRRPLLPKSTGISVMLSAFQSREFGFGYNLSKDLLDKINEKRINQHYKDEEAALDVTQSKKKNLSLNHLL